VTRYALGFIEKGPLKWRAFLLREGKDPDMGYTNPISRVVELAEVL
jgi:hypothetical protein